MVKTNIIRIILGQLRMQVKGFKEDMDSLDKQEDETIVRMKARLKHIEIMVNRLNKLYNKIKKVVDEF